jgi:hypothetical protein
MKYQVQYETTIEVEAEDACDAWEKADKILEKCGPEVFSVYIDGNLVS